MKTDCSETEFKRAGPKQLYITAYNSINPKQALPLSFIPGDERSYTVFDTCCTCYTLVGEPINDEAWHWYNDVVGEKRCTVVDTWWQTGNYHTRNIYFSSSLGDQLQRCLVKKLF